MLDKDDPHWIEFGQIYNFPGHYAKMKAQNAIE